MKYIWTTLGGLTYVVIAGFILTTNATKFESLVLAILVATYSTILFTAMVADNAARDRFLLLAEAAGKYDPSQEDAEVRSERKTSEVRQMVENGFNFVVFFMAVAKIIYSLAR